MHIRIAKADDNEAIRSIYNAEVATATTTFEIVERTVEDQLQWFNDHRGPHAVLVADDDGAVVGYGSLSPYRHRAGYKTTVEISVYVDSSTRGKGVGRALLNELIDLARAQGFHSALSVIVGSNEASIGLHESCGFALVGIEREVGRKFGKWLDVALMQKMLAPN